MSISDLSRSVDELLDAYRAAREQARSADAATRTVVINDIQRSAKAVIDALSTPTGDRDLAGQGRLGTA